VLALSASAASLMLQMVKPTCCNSNDHKKTSLQPAQFSTGIYVTLIVGEKIQSEGCDLRNNSTALTHVAQQTYPGKSISTYKNSGNLEEIWEFLSFRPSPQRLKPYPCMRVRTT
jgi:hypothetical protein